jgi:D-alanine--poly(phosphoribitol) ligase subunit 2
MKITTSLATNYIYLAPFIVLGMKRLPMEHNVADIVMTELEQITAVPRLRLDLDLLLFDEGLLDSLGTVELMLALSDRCGVLITPADLDRQSWATPRKIIADIEARQGKPR